MGLLLMLLTGEAAALWIGVSLGILMVFSRLGASSR